MSTDILTPEYISNDIWKQKYRVEGENNWEDTAKRVAKACALTESEETIDGWENAYQELIENKRFLPGGRIIANAGSDKKKTTLLNCFVLGTIEDSMDSIFQTVKEAALTQKMGGGVGFDFSTIRPRGTGVGGIGSGASGPVSFMSVFDTTCATIMSAGQRRGAQMAVIRCDHPDVVEFIEAKRGDENKKLTHFNISVGITDDFMEAIEKNKNWKLTFEGKIYKTIKARDLWDKITKSAYDYAEPGVLFLDKIKEANTLNFIEEITATNPCVTKDSWIHTTEGPKRVEDLIGSKFTAIVNGQNWETTDQGFFSSGVKPVKNLKTKHGYSLKLTEDHPIYKVVKKERSYTTLKTELKDINIGDIIALSDHSEIQRWGGFGSKEEGYLIGALIGDGCISGERAITDKIEECSSDFYVGFLSGLFDADGSIQGNLNKGISIRLAQSNEELLTRAQRMLSRLGILSRVYLNRRVEGTMLLPDSNKINKEYPIKAQHELVISKTSIDLFVNKIGFKQYKKQKKADKLITSKKRRYRDNYYTEVIAIEDLPEEEVFDCQVPGINMFDANGIQVSNCGEQPLPPYGACLLGSFNLVQYVDGELFTQDAVFDFEGLREDCSIAVRMLDSCIQLSNYPLEKQRQEALYKRRMGIGITSLADTIISLGLQYDSDEGVDFAQTVMREITHACYQASISLAEEKGCCPAMDSQEVRDSYVGNNYFQRIDHDGSLTERILKTGIRNTHLTSIAPTGTMSLVCGNVSSGIEPVFSWEYNRRIRTEDGEKTVKVQDFAYYQYRQARPENGLPSFFTTTDTISPEWHIRMQAALQLYVCSSISKTINIPGDMPFDEFKDVFKIAYESGLKGCTVFRPSDKIMGVLTKDSDKKSKEDPRTDFITTRPDVLGGQTYKLKSPHMRDAVYVTINDIEDKGVRRPYELFVSTKASSHLPWITALSRTISAVFRHDPCPTFLLEELKAVFDPVGGYYTKGKFVPSLVADIGLALERHMNSLGILKEDVRTEVKGETCPSCGEGTIARKEGCLTCQSCGYSKCG